MFNKFRKKKSAATPALESKPNKGLSIDPPAYGMDVTDQIPVQLNGDEQQEPADPDWKKMPFSEFSLSNPEQIGTQQMIPSGKETIRLKKMMDPTSPEYREGWDKLTASQAWSLLAAEMKGEIDEPQMKKRAKDKLMSINAQHKLTYPTTDEILEKIGHHISSRPIASNYHLNAPPGVNRMDKEELAKSSSTTLADLLMKSPGGRFQQVWETGVSQASADLGTRGGIEEQFGYAHALNRQTGKYQGNVESDKFNPRDKAEMPKYAALVSADHQPQGVAKRYGSSVIYWKDEVRNRVSHTPADSWGNFGGRLFTSNKHPMTILAETDPLYLRLYAAEATGFKYDPEFKANAEAGIEAETYIETQIHGELTWAEVDKIVLNYGDAYKTKGGDTIPGNSKEEVENLKRILEKFASDNDYEFKVIIGREFNVAT